MTRWMNGFLPCPRCTYQSLSISIYISFYFARVSTEFYFKTFFIDDRMHVSVPESHYMISQGTTGLHLWEASLFLCDYLICQTNTPSWHPQVQVPDVVQDVAPPLSHAAPAVIIELGAGLGLVSLLLAKFGHCVWATDCQDNVLNLLHSTKDLNLLPNLSIATLDWYHPRLVILDVGRPLPIPDYLIATDCLYDPELIDPLLNTFHYFLQKNPRLVIWIAVKKRNHETFQAFMQKICLSSFCMNTVDFTLKPENRIFSPIDQDVSDIYLFTIVGTQRNKTK
jgi:hypothetical protein